MNRQHDTQKQGLAQGSRRARVRGVSVMEALITLSTAALTLSAAVPSLNEARARRQLEGSAAQLRTDIAQARSLAVSMGESVRFTVQHQGAGACYVIHTGPANSCTCSVQGAATCSAGAQALRVSGYGHDQPVSLQTNSSSMLFSAARGTVTPTGTLNLSTADGRSINLVVNVMGRVRGCTSGRAITGYPAC